MRARYLGWCGVEIEHDGETLLIDYIEDGSAIFQDRRFIAPSRPGRTHAAIVTHLHADHADPVALRRALAPAAHVYRPEQTPGSAAVRAWTAPVEQGFLETGLTTLVAQPWTEHKAGPFRLFAVPAVDGLGDPQRSWIVEADGERILHAGDTMNHGYWWSIADAVGGIDVAFLPVNGPRLDLPHLQPSSPMPAVMLPEEAAVAAHILGARLGIAIHYGDIKSPPAFVETDCPAARFHEAAANLGVATSAPTPGEWFAVGRA